MQNEKDLHKGHRQRLLKKYLENGIHSLEDHEILEILLFFAFSRCNTNDLSHKLINKFGNIKQVLNSPVEEISQIKGIGENSAVFLRFLGDFAETYNSETEPQILLDKVEKVLDFCTKNFQNSQTESFHFLMLDKSNRLAGTISKTDCEFNMVNVDMRSILMKAFNVNASSVIIVHNHPNGTALPSNNDIKCTRNIAETLTALNIQICDHIIIGVDGCNSLRRMKYLEDIW